MAEEEKKGEVQIPVRFRIPSGMASVNAQEMMIHTSVDGALLSFFEVIPPAYQGNLTDEQIKNLQQVGIIAECVGRVFVPKSKYQGFLQALMTAVKNEGIEIPELE